MSANVQTVQAIYAAFGRGDVPTLLSYVSPDVEWEHDGMDHGVPWLKPGRGHAHVVAFLGELAKALDFKVFAPRDFLEGAGLVAVTLDLEVVSKVNGYVDRELEMHLWTFGADGKVTRFKHLCDTHQHVRAAGLLAG